MACALPGGWKEGSRALQEQILGSVPCIDFINNLEVATEDTHQPRRQYQSEGNSW